MRRRRRLLVRVFEASVGDNALAPPRVGEITDFPLSFAELGSPYTGSPVRAAEIVTVRGVLELDSSGPYEHRDHQSGDAWWMWQGLLRGDGWTATWHGTRPLTGSVELVGYLGSALNYRNSGRVRGRITRVRVVSEAYRTVGDTWEVIDDSPSHYRDVDVAPHTHRDAHTVAEDGTYYRDTATLIDLDLDNVPPKPLRPRIVPGHVSAVGNVVWVADTELPVVARIDTGIDAAVEYVLPGVATEYRRVAATPTGCWVTGPDAVYRITSGSGARVVSDVGTAQAAVSGETLLCRRLNGGEWTIHTPEQPPRTLDLPSGDALGSIGVDRSTGDFIVALRPGGRHERRLQLVRITTSGEVRTGPESDHQGRYGWPFFVGTPLRVFSGEGVVATVNDDLTLGPAERLPKRLITGGAIGEHAWILTFRSRRDSDDLSAQWWPLPAPSDPFTPLPRDARLTVLDPHTLAPAAGWYLDQPRAAARQQSSLWICDRQQLVRAPIDSEESPRIVDVSALIAETILPATDQRSPR